MQSTAIALGVIGGALLFVPYIHDQFTHPVVVATDPRPEEVGVPGGARPAVRFNKKMDSRSVNTQSLFLSDNQNHAIPAQVALDASERVATVAPTIPLHDGTTYRLTVMGGVHGLKDEVGYPLAGNVASTFTTGVKTAVPPTEGPGGPLLLITSSANAFSQYYAEILRNEGLNEFAAVDISRLDEDTLSKSEVAVLGEVPVTGRQLALLSKWVQGGGELIAMRPDVSTAREFGFQTTTTPASTTSPLHDAYLAIHPDSGAGAGLVHEPIQFHGPAASYYISNGTTLATFYRNANLPTPFPAISTLASGRGHVVLYSYDLARSVVLTRQGNPLWSGMDRDANPPIRTDDLFYGADASDPQADWVDSRKIAIPQADVQQRLFANILTLASASRMPLPHFWYLPRGVKAAIVMTGDDHGQGGTVERFKSYLARSPKGCSLEDWECVRATSNVFVGSITTADAAKLAAEGFEIGLHVYTGCADWASRPVSQGDGVVKTQIDRDFANALYRRQFAAFAADYPGVPTPVSNRIDCVTWGDYDSQPQVELSHGIRFDTNYYYWPAKWVQNRPGLFTGSGLPMRFATRDGNMIDVYQAATQMTDESGQQYPFTIDTLLRNALGPAEFYAVFTVNMHNDKPKSASADTILSAALEHHIPVVTAAQMLRWLDGRNTSSFKDLSWSNGQLSFTIAIGENANGIQALLPVSCDAGHLASLTADGTPVSYQLRSIAGLTYAAFSGRPGRIQANYRPSGQ